MNQIYYINELYMYPESSKQKFKLMKKEGYKFLFECGHCCTDSVFMDLIRCKTNIQVFNEKQLQLF